MALNKNSFEGATYVAFRVDDNNKAKAWLAIGKDVNASTPEAVEFKYEDKDTKEIVTKYELRYNDIEGIITSIEIKDGQFGTAVYVTIVDGETYILQAGTNTKWGQILLQKLPSVVLGKKYKISPYSIEDEKKSGVYNKSISIKDEDGNKLPNFYYDAVAKKNINGLPEVDEKNKPESKDEWKLFFSQQNIFMAKQLKAKFGGQSVGATATTDSELEDVNDEEF